MKAENMLAILVLLVASATWTAQGYFQSTVSLKNDTVRDKLYENHVAWEISSTSLRECSVSCTTDADCWAFAFVKKSAGTAHVCRGYSAHLPSLQMGRYSESPGAALFQVFSRWTNKAPVTLNRSGASPNSSSTGCSFHSDCTSVHKNTACYGKTCVCSPGYYHSASIATCVLDCAAESLTANFTRYPSRLMMRPHDETYDVTSLQECFNFCITSNNCRSIDFKFTGWGSLRCYLRSTVAFNMEATEFVSHRSYDHYQRQCL